MKVISKWKSYTRLTVILILMMAAAPGEGQVGTSWEPRLLPIYADLDRPIQGAFGSLWATELWVHNAADTVVTIHHRSSPAGIPNGGPPAALEPGGTQRITIDEDFGRIGAMIGVHPIDAADDVHVSLLLRNLASGDGEVTYIPVVRNDRYFVEPVEFVRVVLNESQRLTIRVYDPVVTGRGEFLLQLYDMDGTLLAEEILRTWLDAWGRTENWAPNPQVATADLHRLLSSDPPEAVRIRLSPMAAGIEYWALLSVTDNVTQNVEIIRPD